MRFSRQAAIQMALAATLAVEGSNATPVETTSTLENRATYQAYSGPPDNFPNPDTWIDWDTLWSLNGADCATAVYGQDATSEQYVHDQVLAAASAANIDPRIVFATIIQESWCQIDAPGGGLMQQNMGGISCTPHDESCIYQSIMLGLEGTSTGIGLVGAISTYTAQYGSYAVYPGLRAYNSGANGVNLNDLSTLPSGYGTAAYVSDIANRLLGVTYMG